MSCHVVLGPENYVPGPTGMPWLLMLNLSVPPRSLCPFSCLLDHPEIVLKTLREPMVTLSKSHTTLPVKIS